MKNIVISTWIGYFVASIIISTTRCEVPAYKCEIEDGFCTFWNVDLNLSSYRFFPRADRPQNVGKVRFYNSKIDKFGPDLCHAFTNLKVLEVYFADVQEITEDAFSSCTKLETIDFRYHKLTTLKPDTFQPAKNLTFLRLDAGELTNLPLNIFRDLTNLTVLSVAENKLGLFPSLLVKDLSNLTELWLYSNQLIDLDPQGLLRNLPKLQKVYINDNDFRCDRVQPIVRAFQERGIQGLTYISARERNQEAQKVLDIECLSVEQWNLINNEKGWKVGTDGESENEETNSGQESNENDKNPPSTRLTAATILQLMGKEKLRGFCAQYCDRYYPTY